jgi:hypothetical protein
MLEANKDIKDGAIGEMDYKRKEFWNKKIKTERIGQSGVIRFEVFDENRWQSEIIAYQLKNDIFFLISKYYNIKIDLEPRLIDGPITGPAVSENIWKNVAKSLGLGILMSFSLTIILSLFTEVISRKKQDFFNIENSLRNDFLLEKELKKETRRDLKYIFPKYQSEAEKALEELKEREEAYYQRELERKAEKISSADPVIPAQNVANKKASAPSNLPFTEEDLPEIFNGNNHEEISQEIVKKEPESSYKEATPEEVQARIAKLLNEK